MKKLKVNNASWQSLTKLKKNMNDRKLKNKKCCNFPHVFDKKDEK